MNAVPGGVACVVTLAGLYAGLVAGSGRVGAATIVTGESFNPVLWGPSELATGWVEYSAGYTSDGGAGDRQFLNVVRDDGTWVVKNLPVGWEPGTGGISMGINGSLFQAGAAYQTTIGLAAVSAAPAFTSGVARGAGSPVTYMWNNGWGITEDGPLGDPPPPPPPADPPPQGPVIDHHVHIDMPSLQQGTNECVPTSIANSIKWLDTTHGLGLGMSVESIRDELKKEMGTTAEKGTTGEGLKKGKEKFVTDHKLPIVTTYYEGQTTETKVTKENLFAALKKGDVEIHVTTGGGHLVTMIGYVDLGPGSKSYVLFYDPAVKGTQYTKAGVLETTDAGLTLTLNKTHVIDSFISERVVRPVPTPGALAGGVVLLGWMGVGRGGRRGGQRGRASKGLAGIGAAGFGGVKT